MSAQTHHVEVDTDEDGRVIFTCGEMDVQIVQSLKGDPPLIVFLPEGEGQGWIAPDQVPNLLAALERANDYLQENQ